MADAALFTADLALGLLLGCVFAVIAHGLNLIWGVAKVVNVAHGEFIMLGAYGAYFFNVWFGFNPLLSVPIDAAIGLGVGVIFYFSFLYRELRGKESMGLQSEMVTLVATFGLALVLINVAQTLWTGNNVGIPWSPGVVQIGSLRLPLGGVYVAIMSVAIIALSHVFLTKTYLGNAIRAYSQDIPATQPWIPVFLLTVRIQLLIFSTLSYSLNLITGLTGYVSFGHVVFMAFGSYALAFGVGTLNLPPVAGVALGAVVGLALALGIGVVTLRFRGVYFAIATLVVAVAALYIVLEIKELGDGQGIILNIGFEPLSWFYTIWVILAAEVIVTYWITHGRIGYGVQSIKSDEDAAKSVGVNAARVKLFLYALSGLFAGGAGGGYAWTASGAFPYQAFNLMFSLQMLAMIVIGGLA